MPVRWPRRPAAVSEAVAAGAGPDFSCAGELEQPLKALIGEVRSLSVVCVCVSGLVGKVCGRVVDLPPWSVSSRVVCACWGSGFRWDPKQDFLCLGASSCLFVLQVPPPRSARSGHHQNRPPWLVLASPTPSPMHAARLAHRPPRVCAPSKKKEESALPNTRLVTGAWRRRCNGGAAAAGLAVRELVRWRGGRARPRWSGGRGSVAARALGAGSRVERREAAT